MQIDLNAERRLYVLNHGNHFSCHGFDVVHDEHALIAERLGRAELAPTETGTLAAYQAYRNAVTAWSASVMSRQTFFAPRTPDKVQRILERYRESRKAIRLFLGDPASGRDWGEEHDVVGLIGRSGGTMKVPLLVAFGDDGGGAISTAHVIRIMDVASNSDIYVADNYTAPALELVHDDTHPKLEWTVRRDGTARARFAKNTEAAIYMAFMTGELAAMPDQLRSAWRHLKAA